MATPDDVAAVTSLTRAAYAKWVPVIGREPLPMKADYAVAIRDHRIDLLCDESEVAALVETIQRPGDLLIENVAVAPHFQKRGYGRRMLAHAEQIAIQSGLPEVRLYTNAKFATNLRLYESLGYAVERVEPLYGGIIVHMLKRVP
ncbi:MAG: GNAT family N-acetyltransferase [Azospirillaceae bacterium]|nr:GNAT family N-acetyltransferase [Azospirillaceae bacterium]